MSVKGKFKPKEGQEVVIFPIDPPAFKSDRCKVDLENQKIVGNPDYVPPMPFNPRAEIGNLKARVEKLEKK